MQVYSLSPMYNNYANRTFRGQNETKESSTKKYTKTDYEIAKTKKIASECVTIGLGIASLYFIVKKMMKSNKVTENAKNLVESTVKKVSKEVEKQSMEDLLGCKIDDIRRLSTL